MKLRKAMGANCKFLNNMCIAKNDAECGDRRPSSVRLLNHTRPPNVSSQKGYRRSMSRLDKLSSQTPFNIRVQQPATERRAPNLSSRYDAPFVVACVGLSCRVLSKAVRGPFSQHTSHGPCITVLLMSFRRVGSRLEGFESSNDAFFHRDLPGREASESTFTSAATRKEGRNAMPVVRLSLLDVLSFFA
jgi:hypothetical protein